MKFKAVNPEESEALKALIYQFAEDYEEHFVNVLDNFDKIMFFKDNATTMNLEVYRASIQLSLAFPKVVYVVVAGESFNNLGFDERNRLMFHVLSHIPADFGGDLRDHDVEAFFSEISQFRGNYGRLRALHDYTNEDFKGGDRYDDSESGT